MWPLDEALARTLRREARLGLDRARADAAADPEDQDAAAELEEARHAIREGFRAMMAAGRLAGVGQAGARAGELGAIPAEAWPRATVDWERSALAYLPEPAREDFSRERRIIAAEARAAREAADKAAGARAAARLRAIVKRRQGRRTLARASVKAAARYVALAKRGDGQRVQADREAGDRATARLRAIVKRRDGRRVQMTAVRVRPWLHGPDVPARLAGLPLVTAFRRFVLDDPEFIAALDHARACFPGDYSCRCSEVLGGWFSSTERLWPADLADYDLAVEWMDPPADRDPAGRPPIALDWLSRQSEEDRAAFRMVRAAEAVVRDRVDRFLAPLRTGELVATGHLAGAAEPTAILPAIWCRPGTRIDFVRGDLHLAGVGASPPSEWIGLMLSLPSGRNAPPDTPVGELEAKSNVGRPPKYLWDSARKRLTIKLMHVGEPETGAALARLMAECFEDMRSEAPAEDAICKWLRNNETELWARVTRATRP